MIAQADGLRVIQKHITFEDVMGVPATIAKRAEYYGFLPYVVVAGQTIWGPLLKVLPAAFQAIRQKVESYLVEIFKKLSRGRDMESLPP